MNVNFLSEILYVFDFSKTYNVLCAQAASYSKEILQSQDFSAAIQIESPLAIIIQRQYSFISR